MKILNTLNTLQTNIQVEHQDTKKLISHYWDAKVISGLSDFIKISSLSIDYDPM